MQVRREGEAHKKRRRRGSGSAGSAVRCSMSGVCFFFAQQAVTMVAQNNFGQDRASRAALPLSSATESPAWTRRPLPSLHGAPRRGTQVPHPSLPVHSKSPWMRANNSHALRAAHGLAGWRRSSSLRRSQPSATGSRLSSLVCRLTCSQPFCLPATRPARSTPSPPTCRPQRVPPSD
jgi:hypothetical protein